MRWFGVVLVVIAACSSRTSSSSSSASSSTSSGSGPPAAPATPRAPDPLAAVELPEVAPHGYVSAPAGAPTIVVSPSQMSVLGEPLLELRDGSVAAADKRGPGIRKLRERMAKVGSDRVVTLALDRWSPYRTLLEVMYSAKQAGHRRFGVLARSGARTMMFALELRDLPPPEPMSARRPGADLEQQLERAGSGSARPVARPRSPRGPAPARRPASMPPAYDPDHPELGMIVYIWKGELVLWSISKLEGTLREPRHAVAIGPGAAAEIGRALAEIVERRWADKPRRPYNRTIIVMASPDVPLQTIAELFGAVRATPDGKELFPEVLLSTGLEPWYD